MSARVDYLIARAEQAVAAGKLAREAARAEAVARKQALVDEAEQIAAEATQWKSAGDRLREILDEWKSIKGVDRKTDEQLWKRFAKARDTFNRRRGSHFADLDRTRAAARNRKQELVEEAEGLVESLDWGATATRYKQLMVEWKAAGRAPKDADDALWQRFRCRAGRLLRPPLRRVRRAGRRVRARTRSARRNCSPRRTAIDPSRRSGWRPRGPRCTASRTSGTRSARCRASGSANWRASCGPSRSASGRRPMPSGGETDPEAEARAAQFRERVEQFEAQAAKARAAGDRRRAEQAEAQATQWREWLAAAEQAVASR